MCDSYNIEPLCYGGYTYQREFRVTPGSKRHLELLADIIEFNMASYFERIHNAVGIFGFSNTERWHLSTVYGIIMTTIEYRKDNENLLILAELMKNDDKGAKIYETILNRNNSAKVLFEDRYTFIRPDDNTISSYGGSSTNITPINDYSHTYISNRYDGTIDFMSMRCYSDTYSSDAVSSSTIKSNKYDIMTKLKSKLSRDRKEENDEYACIICADRKKLVVLLPCEHINHCVECAIASIGVDNTCPVCRKTVEDVVVTF